MESNALERSMVIAAVCFLESRLVLISSQVLSSTVALNVLLRNRISCH